MPTQESPRRKRWVPRLALTKAEAAPQFACRSTAFDRYRAPDLPVVRRGRLRIYPAAELERWLDLNAQRTLDLGPDSR